MDSANCFRMSEKNVRSRCERKTATFKTGGVGRQPPGLFRRTAGSRGRRTGGTHRRRSMGAGKRRNLRALADLPIRHAKLPSGQRHQLDGNGVPSRRHW
jgi:hypothetical protein